MAQHGRSPLTWLSALVGQLPGGRRRTRGSQWTTALKWAQGPFFRVFTAVFLVLSSLPLSVLVPPSFFLAPQAAEAATFTVTKEADTNDGACNADCSLREAIVAANAAAGTDTITLPAGLYDLTITGASENAAATGDLDITGDLTINGAGAGTAGTRISGASLSDRIFHIIGSITVTINDVTIQNASAAVAGGAIANNSILTLNRVAVSGNSTSADGGGIFVNTGATLHLKNSTISGNTTSSAGNGAGIRNQGTALITNSTISGNTVSGSGSGGGINNTGGKLTLANVTVANNTAGTGSGLVRAGDVIIRNSIVAHNNTGSNCSGTPTTFTSSYNLSNDTSCGFTGTGDQQGVNAQLGTLANNSPGTTATHALNAGSPAIDTGDPTGCKDAGTTFGGAGTTLTADQRGSTRPLDGDGNGSTVCDKGAYEAQAASPGTLQFSAATYSVAEDGGSATITVTRTGGSDGAVSVDYATSDGTATAGSDYTTASGTLNFANSETSKTFTVPITDDALAESDETVNLTLSSPTGGASLGSTTTATLTIVDNDVAQPGTLQFAHWEGPPFDSDDWYGVVENDGPGGINITVLRTGGSDGTVTVDYATSDGTATAGADYTAASGTLTFADGETTKTFFVAILPDSIHEGQERVNLTLSNPTGGATLGTSATTLRITNLDPSQSATFQFSAATSSVNENAGSVTITVTRAASEFGTVTVDYATSNGTATAASDYSAVSGTLTFTEGQSSQTFSVTILDDSAFEGDETFTVTLSNPTGGAILGTPSEATVTITENESAPAQPGILQYSAATYNVDENGGSITVTITRTGGTDGTVTVRFTTSDGTAIAGSDYAHTSSIHTFADGETTKTFPVSIIDDAVFEGDETIHLILSDLTGGATLGPIDAATIIIRENDSAPAAGALHLDAATYNVNENPGGNITITIVRTGGTAGEVTVQFATSDGTATSPSDYLHTASIHTFADGETIKTFPVTITNDGLAEGNETLNVLLSEPTGGAILSTPSTATITIADDETPQPGALQFSAVTYSGTEGNQVQVQVTRTGGSEGTVTVDYATSDGTATAGPDYTAASGTLTLGPGVVDSFFDIFTEIDATVEGNETVNLALTNPTGGAVLGMPHTATVTIVDDIDPVISVAPTSLSKTVAQGGTGTETLTISNTVAAGGPSLNFTITDELDLSAPGGSSAPAGPSGPPPSRSGPQGSARTTTNFLTIAAVGGPDAPWLSEDPASGTVAPQGSQDVTVTFDAASLLPGTYHANILVAHDGSGTSPVTVPVTLTVTESAESLALAQSLAEAMGVNPADLVSAGLRGSDLACALVYPSPLDGFPTQGSSFAILASGLAASADDPDTNNGETVSGGGIGDDVSAVLPGLNTNQGQDLCQLRLTLNVPAGSDTLALNFGFFSEEWPDFYASDFNDAFLSELGISNFVVNGDGTITAPNNFALDSNGNQVSVNVGFGLDPSNPNPNTGTTYDGTTGLLTAITPVTGGTQITLTLSVFDVGDSILDSAVFLDNLRFLSGGGTGLRGLVVTHSDGGTTVSETGTTDTFTVKLSHQPTGNVVVGVTSLDTGEVTVSPASLTFTPSDWNVPQVVTVTGVDDASDDDTQTTAISLIVAAALSADEYDGVAASVSVTTTDDDEPAVHGSLQFDSATYTVDEQGVKATIPVTRSGGSEGSVTVNYATSDGTAAAGADFTQASGTLTFGDGQVSSFFDVFVTIDSVIEGDETVNLALSNPTGGAVLGTPDTAVLTITNNSLIPLVPISTNFNGMVGIDHHPPTNQVVVSVNYPGGEPYNFELVAADGTRTQFSPIHGLGDEIKIGTVRNSACQGGFIPGELFTGTGVPGVVARIAADGSSIQNPWVTLPDETGLMRGGLFQDRYCVFGGDLIVVTTAGGVWRITAAGVPTKLADIGTHLEGVTTAPNDTAKYGPWAGKILAGAEGLGRVYSIDAAGNTAFYELGINPEDLDIIPAHENFFGVDYGASTLRGAPASAFTSMVGDVLITDEGGTLWHVRWDGSQFQKTLLAVVSQWEHVTFSPAGLVEVPPALSLTLNPFQGFAVTTVVQVTGNGFDTSTQITDLQFDGVTLGDVSLPITLTGSGPHKTFTASFQVPAGAAGQHTVTAVGNGAGEGAVHGIFTVVPTPFITLTPDHGEAGSSFNIAGSNFAPTTAVTLYWDAMGNGIPCSVTGTLLGTTMTNPSGSFSITLSVPACATLGGHDVYAVQGGDTPAATVGGFTVEAGVVDERTLAPGATWDEPFSVFVPGTLPRVDVVFSFDLTGSMGGILDTAKARAQEIMTALDATGSDIQYGVVSYMDYNACYDSYGYSDCYGTTGDYPYRRDQSVTANRSDVSTAINGLVLGNGMDGPESYTRMMYESYADTGLGWRPGARRIVLNFGDNVPHDNDLNEGVPSTSGVFSTGGDPGRDGVILTADDLDLQTVLAEMNNHHITLLEAHSSASYEEYWDHWTGITGGDVFLTTSGTLVDDVVTKVTSLVTLTSISNLHLETTPGFAAWMTSVDPPSYSGVRNVTVDFTAHMQVPAGAAGCTYTFQKLAVDSDGVVYKIHTVIVHVTGLPGLSITDASVTEGDSGLTNATFTVSLCQVSANTVTVDFATQDGTATAGSDYLTSNGTLTFAPDETTKTVTVLVNGDTTHEPNETFAVNLSNPTNAVITDNQGVGTITNDDAAPTPTISINDVTVTEPDSGTVDATFTVTLSNPSSQTVTVDFTTTDGTATAVSGDYVTNSGTVTFAPGDTSETITVLVYGDITSESNETFTVNLTNPTNATIADAQGVGTITDNDGVPSISINDVTVTEPDSGATNAVFTVTLSNPSSQTVTVDFATADGTADSGVASDYVANAGIVTFAPGSTTETITVLVNGDVTDEDDETFTVTLTNPTNATIGDGTGLGTIIDNDGAGSVFLFLEPDPATASLGGGPVDVRIMVNAGSQPLDAVQVRLTYNPTTLQIEDGDGNAGNGVQLVPGPVFQQVPANTVDTTNGVIDFGGGRGTAQTPPTGTFILAVIRVSGLAEGTWPITFDPAGIEAAYDGSVIPATHDSGVVQVVARQLVFTTQPIRGAAGIALGYQPVVVVKDTAGNVLLGDNTTVVTLNLLNGPAGSALTCAQTSGGVTSVTVVDGEAMFSNCSINVSAAGYVLEASAGGLGTAYTDAFNITWAGDTNASCTVSAVDFSLVVTHFGKNSSHADWVTLLLYRADLNGDGRVSIVDFSIVVSRFLTATAVCAPASNGNPFP